MGMGKSLDGGGKRSRGDAGFPVVLLRIQWLQESDSSGDIRDLYFLDQRDMRWVCMRSLNRRVLRRGQIDRCSQCGPSGSRDPSAII